MCTQGSLLLPGQFRSVKGCTHDSLPLTVSKIDVMHVLGLSLTIVSVYRSPSAMAATSALAKPSRFWLAQMPTSVCTLSMCVIMHQMLSLLSHMKLSPLGHACQTVFQLRAG